MKRAVRTKTVVSTTLLALLLATGAAGVARAEDGSDNPTVKPVNVEKRVIVINKDGEEQVIEGDGPAVKHGYLGVGLTELTPELRTHFGAPESSGVMVSKVEAGSPAEKAGLRVGDILTSLDGAALGSSWDVRAKARDLKDGERVPVEIRRDGKVQTISVVVEERARPEIDLAPFVFKGKPGEPMVLRMGDGDIPLPPGAFEMHDGEPGMKRMVIRKTATPREADLEKKLKNLEKRLNDLEKQLAKKP